MKGPVAVLILIVGWIGAYFLLTEAIPEHQREQTEEMPGYRKAGSILGEVRLVVLIEAPAEVRSLRVQVRSAGAAGEPVAQAEVPAAGGETRVELTLPQTEGAYDLTVEGDRGEAGEPLRAVQREIQADGGPVRVALGQPR